MLAQLKKFWNILLGKTGKILDKLEDPEEQLSVFVNELNQQISQLQKSVAAAMADEKRMKLELDQLGDKATDWERRAILALESGDEKLAKEALLKKEECDARANALRTGWETQKKATDHLKLSLGQAKEKVSEAKRQYTLLIARYKSVETRKKLAEATTSTFSGSPMEAMEHLNDKILKLEAETEAQLEAAGEFSKSDTEAKFLALEQTGRGESALEQLKLKLAERKQIGGPIPIRSDKPGSNAEESSGEEDQIQQIKNMKAKLSQR